MDELTSKPLSELATLIRNKAVSAVEVCEAHLRRIEQINPMLNAIVTVAPDVIDKAREAEAATMRGGEVGALNGVPITVKDTIETQDLRTTSGSRVRSDYIPLQDAPAVAALRKAGAIILGKTNVAEMAASYDTENAVFGRANNPYDLSRTTGGSSGGEAAAIAACLSPGGLGSDLMGSIRVPAHFCGVVGLRPTTGLVSCSGHIPTATGPASLGAVIGPIARYVDDVSLLLGVLSNRTAQSNAAMQSELRKCRVAWYTSDGVTDVTDETKKAVALAASTLASAGLEVREEKPPGVERGHDLWSALFARPSLVQMKSEYEGHEGNAGPFVRYLLESSTFSQSPTLDEYSRVWIERDQLRASLLEWMSHTQLLIAPVCAMSAFPHGARNISVHGKSTSIFRACSYSQTFNVFDLPSVSVPTGLSTGGIPVGVQIIGRPYTEELVLAAASVVEQALGGWQMPAVVPSNNSAVRI